MLGKLHQVCHLCLGDGKAETACLVGFNIGADDFFRFAIRQTRAGGKDCFAIGRDRLTLERTAPYEGPACEPHSSLLVALCGGGRGQYKSIREKSCKKCTCERGRHGKSGLRGLLTNESRRRTYDIDRHADRRVGVRIAEPVMI